MYVRFEQEESSCLDGRERSGSVRRSSLTGETSVISPQSFRPSARIIRCSRRGERGVLSFYTHNSVAEFTFITHLNYSIELIICDGR